MGKRIAVIGSGISGLAAAACCAQHGHRVTVYEKNASIGGRARQFTMEGFTFDMGPSWYWMPDVFEHFYRRFGHTTADLYPLQRLDPSYRVYFGPNDFVDVPAEQEALYALVEELEPGAAPKLRSFLKEAEYKYTVGVHDFAFKPGLSIREFMEPALLKSIFRLELLRSISSSIRARFTDPRLIRILEFPVLFLGAKPSETPALYSLMNHADMNLGTWYPQGGMHRIVEALERICTEQGVEIQTNASVQHIHAEHGLAQGIEVDGQRIPTDIVVATADYHHVEQRLLRPEFRDHTEAYWQRRRMSPSCLIYFVGVNKEISGLLHHTLFFDTDFDDHLGSIYDHAGWPKDPLFYVCAPTKTDVSVAPEGCENLFILIPVAVDLDDNAAVRERYFELVMGRMERLTGRSIKEHVTVKRSYARQELVDDHNSFKGNAYGLANTLSQTALLKPSMRSRSLKNLFFAGQLTTPGPGVPPALISGQVVAAVIEKDLVRTRDPR